MGCGAQPKQSVESIVLSNDLTANPTKSVPTLLDALEQSRKDARKQESTKKNLPRIFELLSKAMGNLSETDSKPVIAACGVIEHCAKVHNDICGDRSEAVETGAESDAQPEISAEYLKQCQRQLVVLLKRVIERAHKHFVEVGNECETSSKELKAISLATVALFKLEKHGSDCKQAFMEADGVAIAFKSMESTCDESGIKIEARKPLAWVMCLLVDDAPQNVESIIQCGGTYKFVPYVLDPSRYSVPKDMLVYCSTVLEACLEHGAQYDLKDADDIRQAIEKTREVVKKRVSQMERQISPSSAGFDDKLERQASPMSASSD